MVINDHFQNLKSGQKLSPEAVQSLDSYCEAHPYSPTLAALYGKALKTSDSAEAENAIRIAALLSADRSQLHEFVFADPPIKEEESSTIESESITDPLEEQIISAAIGSGAVLDLIGSDNEIKEAKDSEEDTEPAEQIVAPTVNPISGPRSFGDWMLTLDSKEEESEKVDSEALIDQFIESEDDVVPKRAEFFSPTKVAKKSTEDNEEIVSETLAKVYAAQGDLNKAISTYNKLSLLDPEKSSYFAALIQKLKEEKKLKS